jgi:DNA polymerase
MMTLSAGQKQTAVVRVYDIANCGPRNRFVANGKVVSNCNWQNFERPSKTDPRKGTVRKSICAPEGDLLFGGDASQIEARFNAWYSGHDDLVADFAAGRDVYSLFASKVYGRPIDRKKNAEDEVPGFVGKTSVLGLGYGMGYLKFGSEMMRGAGGAPAVQFMESDLHQLGVDPTAFLANPKNVSRILEVPSRLTPAQKLIHYSVAEHIVKIYRSENTRIKENWAFMGQVIKLMAEGARGVIGSHGILELVDGGILLPSGLVMHYQGLRKEDSGEYTYMAKRGQRCRVYGALLAENVTQALCRIVVSDAMLKLHEEGRGEIRIGTMEHDAIIGQCRAEAAPHWTERLLHHLSTPPSWAPGLPLAAEGGFGATLADTK